MPVKADEREKLITENMGLVHSCAGRFKGKGVEYDDLFQAGCVGLVKAADGYDSSRGFAFSTYAVPVILGEIRRIFRDGGTVKVSRMLKEKSRSAIAERERLARLYDREPTLQELAKPSVPCPETGSQNHRRQGQQESKHHCAGQPETGEIFMHKSPQHSIIRRI